MIEKYQDHEPQIHPSVYVHPSAVIIGRVTVGAESSIWPATVLRGDDNKIVIGQQTSIQDGTVVHLTSNLSETIVGDKVTVGHSAVLHGCIVADECIIGMGSILLDNCKIGKQTIIGAGAVIPMNKVIPDGVVVMGNPYKVVRDVTDKDLEWIEFSWKHYVQNAKLYAAG